MKINSLILILVTLEYQVISELITPRTFPDVLGIYRNGTVDLTLIQNDKPWFAYVRGFVQKSMSECFAKLGKATPFGPMWKCFYHFQPSHQAMLQKLSRPCPEIRALHAVPVHYMFMTGFLVSSEIKQRNVVGQVLVDPQKCPAVFKVWFQKNIAEFLMWVCSFHANKKLRINVTFVEIQLLKIEKLAVAPKALGVHVWNQCYRVDRSCHEVSCFSRCYLSELQYNVVTAMSFVLP